MPEMPLGSSTQNHTIIFKKTSCPYPRHFLKAPYQRGPFVYRLGRQVFNLKRRVRLPYGLPGSYPNFRDAAFLPNRQSDFVWPIDWDSRSALSL